MDKITSFTIDHLKLLPGLYVSRKDIAGDCVITTFDIRMTRPNYEPVLNTAEVHTIEHLGATFLRNHPDYRDKVLYFGPMGCRTGFYLIMWGDVEPQTVKDGLEKALKMVLEATEIPAATKVECGNYKDLSLFGAKEYAKEALEKGFSLNIYGD